jgi:excisionase family DNA binding protein
MEGEISEPVPSRNTKTIPEVTVELGIGRNAAYEAAKRREIPTVRIGRRLLVPRDTVNQMLRRTLERSQ